MEKGIKYSVIKTEQLQTIMGYHRTCRNRRSDVGHRIAVGFVGKIEKRMDMWTGEIQQWKMEIHMKKSKVMVANIKEDNEIRIKFRDAELKTVATMEK